MHPIQRSTGDFLERILKATRPSLEGKIRVSHPLFNQLVKDLLEGFSRGTFAGAGAHKSEAEEATKVALESAFDKGYDEDACKTLILSVLDMRGMADGLKNFRSDIIEKVKYLRGAHPELFAKTPAGVFLNELLLPLNVLQGKMLPTYGEIDSVRRFLRVWHDEALLRSKRAA